MKPLLGMVWITIGTTFAAISMAVWLFLRFNPQFGGKITPKLQNVYEKSPHWKGGNFENQSETVMDVSLRTAPKLIRLQFTDRKSRQPKTPLAILPFDAEAWRSTPEKPKFIWYGHSVLLLQVSGKTILIDPMLGPNAAPIVPFGGARFSKNTLDIIDTLPPLDAILLTHDHYDHLDLASIRRLKGKTDIWLVALGVSRHLERWGIPKDHIQEFDWWQETTLADIRIVFTPSRHFSGRGPTDRAKSFWGGWVFITEDHRIYWSGDGGYDDHFKEVGERFGPFDWGFMECGQYHEMWHHIHNYPEECVQGGVEAKAQTLIPVHWGGFALALHPWKEPVERFIAASENQGASFLLPQLGQVIIMGEDITTEKWFEGVE